MSYRKKLIEVALPLEAINEASARENPSGTPPPQHPTLVGASQRIYKSEVRACRMTTSVYRMIG